MPVASRSHVLAAYASFLWEQDDDLGEGEQGTGGAGAPDQRAATTQQAGQVTELASAAVWSRQGQRGAC